MSQFRVHGQPELDPTRQASALDRAARKAQFPLVVKHNVRVGFARDGHAPAVLDAVAPDDLVEVELEGGVRFWTRADDLQSDFALKASRGASGADVFELPTQLAFGGASRGMGDWIIRGLKVLGVDVAGEIAEFVADKVEGQIAPGPGLYRCSPTRPDDLSAPRTIKGDKPTLVFLHGTGSSTQGGFSDLWGNGAARMRELAAHYGDDILALQHRTLSLSPIENARDLVAALAKVLPARSELHLVSHSRGGLVGELMARGNRLGGGSFDDDDLRLFAGKDRARDLAALKELRALFEQQRYAVSLLVRVACPTRGTTLADKRLDRYLSVILNVLDAIPGYSESGFDMFASLLAAVATKRTDPRELPGLEAMMPISPLVRLLNRPDVRTDSVLRILGGDVQGTGFWGRLKAFVTDLYYREDHDLVVNTPAMFGGAERVKTPKYWIDTGGRVNHFNYFANADTAARLVSALKDEAATDFHDVTVPLGGVTEDDYRKRAPVPQPVVFVLPGTMGSNLEVNGNRIWIDLFDLARGGMRALRADAKKVRAESLVASSYQDLVRHLSASHEVIPFPYDWRLPLAASAEVLRKAIDAKLDAQAGTNQPVRLLAHSMGGLVVRAMLATREGLKTWARMCEHPGARFLMLGTPNGGSHAIGAMLMGRDAVTRKLALVDLTSEHGNLLKIVSEFDGALQLLPHAGTFDLLDAGVWTKLHTLDARDDRGIVGSTPDPSKSANVDWTVPAASRLAAARASRDALASSPVDAGRMIYIAGVADQTPCDIVIDEQAPPGRRVTVLATTRGDGRVPWATGIPRELASQTYYLNATHGDLASTEDAFPAIVELLNAGTTTRLSKVAPVARGDAPDTFPYRTPEVDAYPDALSLATSAIGGRAGRKRRREQERVAVRVVHDNLGFARSPVLVGHYLDDVLVGAEAYLDSQLHGRLRRLGTLDLYPGACNTAVVVLNHADESAPNRHPGAIVAGLGRVGELASGTLTSTLAHALTMYGAESLERELRRRQQGLSSSADPVLRLPVTSLLVGAGAGGVRLADSLQSLLRAIQTANTKLASTAPEGSRAASGSTGPASLTARIVSADIVELYEDRAIEAVHELDALARVSEFRTSFDVARLLVPSGRGVRRATFEELPGWWQRMRIARQNDGTLKFELLTDTARVPAVLQPTQQLMVSRLLERATRSTATDLDLSATLFELLVPLPLKERAPDRRELVLVVDETSAVLPWELMHDRWSEGSRPIAVDTGLVRQLVTTEFRPRVLRAPGNSALVIGDPPLDGSPVFRQLPGAAAEATAVVAVLRDGGFDTTPLIGEDARWSAVLSNLFGQPHRVLHIAAHGVHEFAPEKDAPKVTGVVLGDGAFLTPAEFQQLRIVPDLVFINCCHLAAGGEFGRQVDVAFPQLASNVAQQLIRMGVRAVVAAGWAVDDQAAKEFARTFYREMLNGAEFGKAVQRARDEIYNRFGSVNTWGAYQCYGDPGFTFRGTGLGRGSRPFVAERELRYEVMNIASKTETASPERCAELSRQLGELVGSADQTWLASGATCAAIARAYGELGQFDNAVKFYERVLVAEPATASLQSVEELANLLARLADKRATPDLSFMERSAELLQHLAAIGRTAERLALVGATSKRWALRASGADRVKALREMTAAYAGGYEVALKNKVANAWYPLQNLVAGKIALSWHVAKRDKAIGGIDADLKALRAYADKVAGSETDFWELCLPADVSVLEAVHGGSLPAKARESVAQQYRTAATRAGTPKMVASATGQIDFLKTMAASSKRPTLGDLAKSLGLLIEVLKKE